MMKSLLSSVSPFWAVTNACARKVLLPHAKTLPAPVISVGNIVAGGVGKTETVARIAKYLIEQKGKRVVVASRGYGSDWSGKGGIAKDFLSASNLKFPDEALVLLKKVPGVQVAVAADRHAILTRHWEELSPDVVLLDDGYQHFKIARSLDILVHDFSIPWPVLRDFPSVFNKVPLRIALSEVPALWQRIEWVRAQYSLNGVVDAFGKQSSPPKEALLFCGIGNPKRFVKSLKERGIKIHGTKFFSDHHDYTKENVQKLVQWRKSKGSMPLLTTLKDFVKLQTYIGSQGSGMDFEPQWVDIQFDLLSGEAYLWEKVNEALVSPSH